MKAIGIIGAGFAGAVLAHELAASGLYEIEVFDQRSHVAGNSHTSRDAKTGIMLHHYGPHIFNTSREDVWAYVQRFATFGSYTNRVKAVTARGIYSLPINLLTINQFFNKQLNPEEARAFVATLAEPGQKEAQTFEEQGLKFLGRELYDAFFYGYTKKQWGVEPHQLPASILKRLPVRFNYDDNYYASKYQGIPLEGYTVLIQKLLDHPRIRVHLGESFEACHRHEFRHVFYSGPIDGFFAYEFGPLRYRTLRFERGDSEGDFQGNAVLNYCQESVPYTRVAEHKHFTPWEEHKGTVYFREYSALAGPGDIPYYPLGLAADKALMLRYRERAKREKGLTFIGRLGTYRYLDMHMVIGEALDLAKACMSRDMAAWPCFGHEL